MNKFIIPILLAVTASFIGSYFLFFNKNSQELIQSPAPQVVNNPIMENKQVDFSASFLIYTNGTKRIFTDTKYHNQSEDVFITSENPSVINIKKEKTTWRDFFNTLPSPMKVEEACLYTGSGQTFCNDKVSSLKFYLNGQKQDDILTKTINDKDELLISFGPAEDPEIKNQLLNFP